MNKSSFTNGGETWVRVTKNQARATYNSGLTVLLCPVKMRPFSPWHLEMYVVKSEWCEFDAAISCFEHYNCDSETGRYTAFYVQIGGVGV